MADQQKPVDAPKEEAAPVAPTTAPVETAPVEATTVDAAPAPALVETQPAEQTEEVKPTEASTEAEPTTEAPKEEVKPVEEGQLAYKAQGLGFPKNLISSKEFFFFGNEPLDTKALSAYQRSEKSVDVAHSNIAWAAQTGKGLLFVGDKQAPSHIINLSDATEPEVDGANKFHFSAKGNKHSFKATSTAERDNWVSQLKLKIAEAKELATTVPESETYKTTLESFKPTVPAVAPKAEETTKTEEAAAEPEVAPEAVTEAPKEEPKKDVEEPKRRSASRKRASFFSFGGKKESKADEVKPESPATETAPAVEAEAPKTEEVKATETPEAVPAVTSAAPVTTEEAKSAEEPLAAGETKPVETGETPKPLPVKRNSIFGVFGRKEKKADSKAAEAKPVENAESPKDEEPATESTAPVIPPVETTTPLAVEVSSPANLPTTTTDATPAADKSTVEAPKEKRKSSLPFNFGRKSPPPAEGEEKSGGLSAFSKLRATINRKSSTKPEDKTAETKDEETKEEGPAVPAKEEPVAAAEPAVENKPENVATTTPAVTAAA
ncbi:hypothetical protein S40293_03843 [Stachybotrys chartarum IBT 40293]|nr:hypothetical protein S40293_03843 [Stachybotrys chartarum IBT 40293]